MQELWERDFPGGTFWPCQFFLPFVSEVKFVDSVIKIPSPLRGERERVRGAKMKSRARALRRSMTDAEKLLWRSLRDRQMDGWKFRRQHPIRPFIVDFVCVERKLIIELDGGQHASKIWADASRSSYLRKKGYKILRFWNNQVLKETKAVLDTILVTLNDDTPSPRPSPPNLGERESR